MLAALAEAGRRLGRADWLARGARARRVPPRAALHARRAAAPHLPARPRRGHAAVLDDYADVANGLLELHAATATCAGSQEAQPPRPARRRALRATTSAAASGSRRVDGEQLVARKKDARRPPDPVRELDARLRPAPARADLRRRRARAARRRRAPARARLAWRASRPRSGTRSARSTSTSRRRGSSRSSGLGRDARGAAPPPRSPAGSRTPSSPGREGAARRRRAAGRQGHCRRPPGALRCASASRARLP